MCVIIFLLFAGCSVIVGHHNILPCAAPFKSLQGLGVPFSFLSFKLHCKLLIITLLMKIIYIVSITMQNVHCTVYSYTIHYTVYSAAITEKNVNPWGKIEMFWLILLNSLWKWYLSSFKIHLYNSNWTSKYFVATFYL